MDRLPAVAGYFYPENKNELDSLINKVFESKSELPGKLIRIFPLR